MSENPRYVRPRKLNNKETFVFDSNEIVVTATNVQSKAQLRLSGRHRIPDEDNNNSAEAMPARRPLPPGQNRNPAETGPVRRSFPQEQNRNNQIGYELLPGVKNVKNDSKSKTPNQTANRLPRQVPTAANCQPIQLAANHVRQLIEEVNNSDRQSTQADGVTSRQAKVIQDAVEHGRYPSQERAYGRQRQNDHGFQNSQEEVEERSVRRRHPAGNASNMAQDSDSQPILPRQGWSGGAQARLSSNRRSATSINTISNKESLGLDDHPRNSGRPLVAPSCKTTKDSGNKQRVLENDYRGVNVEFSGISWQDKVQYIEQDRWILDQQPDQEREEDGANRNINHNRVVYEQELKRFQTLNLRENFSVNNNEIGFSLTAKNKMSKCICDRDLKLVFCQSCLHSSFGRIRKQCDLHPKNHYLLDMTSCSSCKKEDLKEYDIPANIDVSSIKNRLKKNMN